MGRMEAEEKRERKGNKKERRETTSLLLAAGSPAVSASAHTAAYCSSLRLNYSQAQCTLWGHAACVGLCVYPYFLFKHLLVLKCKCAYVFVQAVCYSMYTGICPPIL